MQTIDDMISFEYYKQHCHEISINSKKFGCEHDGIRYGTDMCAVQFGIFSNINGDMSPIVQEEYKGKVQFKNVLKKFIVYLSQCSNYFERMLNYNSERQFHVYSDDEYQHEMNNLNRDKISRNTDSFRDLSFMRNGKKYHMSVNVNICQQMLYCCEIIPEDEAKHWFFQIKMFPKYEEKESEKYVNRCNKARKLTDEELYEHYKKQKVYHDKCRRKGSPKEPYKRNEIVAEIAKRRAKGMCDLADEKGEFHKAPFEINGKPFLESHHVKWLSKGGKDDIDNVVALCPNCHRKVHMLCKTNDEEKLRNRLLCYQEEIKKLKETIKSP